MILLVDVERSKRELRFVLEESSKLEVVLGVKSTFHSHVVLEKFKELLLKRVDLFSNEEGVDVSKISVREILVIPDFLRDKQRAEDQRTPISRIKR